MLFEERGELGFEELIRGSWNRPYQWVDRTTSVGLIVLDTVR